MALSRQKKEDTVTELQALLTASKMTVLARYSGTPVRAMQELRSTAKESGTQVRVVKNRLFKKALEAVGALKDVKADEILHGQLLYAFNEIDETAPAQSLAAFAKTNPRIEFVAAITNDGQLLSAEDVQALASLPGKDQLRAQLVATVASPVSGLVNTMAANVRSVLNVLNSRSNILSSTSKLK